MTQNEQEQFAAKQIEKYCRNTYCGQCGDIIKQDTAYWVIAAAILSVVGIFFYRDMPTKYYKCSCFYNYFESEYGKAVLNKAKTRFFNSFGKITV